MPPICMDQPAGVSLPSSQLDGVKKNAGVILSLSTANLLLSMHFATHVMLNYLFMLLNLSNQA